MQVRFRENMNIFYSVFSSLIIPVVGDVIVIANVKYIVQSRVVDYGNKEVDIHVKRMRDEIENS